MHPRYPDWLTYAFDHPVTEPQWYFALDAPEFAASDSEVAVLMAETFQRSGEDLRRFSGAQVNQAIWFLTSPSGSDYGFCFRDGEVPLADKVAGIHSIFHLYRDCFAVRCSQTLGGYGVSEPGASDLNPICWGFWDISPLTALEGVPNRPELENAVLGVLEGILQIEHRACREGALVGLHCMSIGSPERAAEVLDSFLARAKLDDALRSFAQGAR
jgi:hypothetical protein